VRRYTVLLHNHQQIYLHKENRPYFFRCAALKLILFQVNLSEDVFFGYAKRHAYTNRTCRPKSPTIQSHLFNHTKGMTTCHVAGALGSQVHTHTHLHTHTHAYTHMPTCTHSCAHIHTHAHTHMHTHTHLEYIVFGKGREVPHSHAI
jgi:hypothetical protein